MGANNINIDVGAFSEHVFFIYKPESLNIDIGQLLERESWKHSFVHYQDIENELLSDEGAIVLFEYLYFNDNEKEIIEKVCQKQQHKIIALNNFERETLFEIMALHLKQIKAEKKLQLLENQIASNARFVNLGELTGSVIHDLNNYTNVCLASFSGINYVIEKKGDLESVKKFSDLGERSVHELVSLSKKCESFIKSGEQRQEEVFHLYDICQWLVGMFKDQLRESQIELNIDVNQSVIMKTDKATLTQSLLNLVKNSIKALSGLSDKDKWITISFKHKRDFPTISVLDSGQIPEAERKEVFKKYYTSDQYKGHGIGLYIVRKNLLNIDIRIELDPTGNTCFNLLFNPNSVTYGKLSQS